MLTIRTTLKSLLICSLCLLISILVYREWIFPNTGLGIQLGNMKKAEVHADAIRGQIHSEARFKQVSLDSYTGMNGALFVGGSVPVEADINDLKNLIDSSECPVNICYQLWANEWTNKPNEKAQQSGRD